MESENISNIIVELVERENKNMMFSIFALIISTISYNRISCDVFFIEIINFRRNAE